MFSLLSIGRLPKRYGKDFRLILVVPSEFQWPSSRQSQRLDKVWLLLLCFFSIRSTTLLNVCLGCRRAGPFCVRYSSYHVSPSGMVRRSTQIRYRQRKSLFVVELLPNSPPSHLLSLRFLVSLYSVVSRKKEELWERERECESWFGLNVLYPSFSFQTHPLLSKGLWSSCAAPRLLSPFKSSALKIKSKRKKKKKKKTTSQSIGKTVLLLLPCPTSLYLTLLLLKGHGPSSSSSLSALLFHVYTLTQMIKL